MRFHSSFGTLSLNQDNLEKDDEIESPPLSDKIFSSPSKMGSFKVGDSTFYSLIENYANSGDFDSLEKVFVFMGEKSFVERLPISKRFANKN